MYHHKLFMIMAICAASLACAVEEAEDGQLGREALVEEAEDQVSLAFADHAACETEPEAACVAEETELREALESLAEAKAGDDALVFRASATVSCGGTSFTCNGSLCWAEDGEGCVCTGGVGVWSVHACEQ